MDEIDVEIPLWLGRGAIIRRAKEKVAIALNALVLPFHLMLPDLVTGDVSGVVGALHQLHHGAVIGTVQGIV